MGSSNQTPASKGVKILLAALFIICGAVFLVDFLFMLESFDKHAIYKWENWPGFYGVLGFVSCFLLVLVSKFIIAPLIQREENFYE